jgi:hypothetical protein
MVARTGGGGAVANPNLQQSYMSGIRSDMSELGRICPVWGANMTGHQKLRAVKK